MPRNSPLGSAHWSSVPPLQKRVRGRHQGHQHVAIDRHVVPPANPLLVVARELKREILGHIVHRLTPVAAGQCGAGFATATRESGGDALILRGGPKDGPAQARVTLNAECAWRRWPCRSRSNRRCG